MKFCKFLLIFSPCGSIFAQQLVLSSGAGQIVLEQFVAKPFVVCALGQNGGPLPNVPVTWTVPERQGTINFSDPATDTGGCATARFLGTSIQPGTSWAQTTVTASTSFGSVSFPITTVPNRVSEQPTVQLVNGSAITGPAGSTIENAFTVVIAAGGGIRLGQGIPNVGVRAVLGSTADPATAPGGTCDAPGGIVYTDERGRATCNLKLNSNVGIGGIYANTGEFQLSPGIPLTITAAADCRVTLDPTAQNYGGAGGGGSFSVASSVTSTCAWTAVSNAPWIVLQGTSSGSGNGSVSFTVGANSGSARTGTVSVNNATFTISQAAQGSAGPLAFSLNPALPQATTGQSYSVTLNVSGGQAPYVWSASSVPAGLTLNAQSGVLSGTSPAVGTYTIPVTVRDASGTTATQTFTLIVNQPSQSGGALTITTTALAFGLVGTSYQQIIGVSGGCQNPFAGGPRLEIASGSLPAGLTLQAVSSGYQITGTPTTAGSSAFTLRATDACGSAPATRDLTILITSGVVPAPVMSASTTGLTFAYTAGASAPAEQTFTVSAGSSALAFTAAATSAANWLSVLPTSASTPGTITVRATPANLVPGVYPGTITLTSLASNSPVVIPASLTITQPAGSVSPSALAFAYELNSVTPTARTLALVAPFPLTFSVAASTTSGGAWLTASPSSGVTPASISVSVNPQGLAPGAYAGEVIVSGLASSPTSVPVTLTITQAPTQVTSIVNSASLLPGPVAPGEILTLRGTNLASETATFRLGQNGLIDTTLSGVRVWFDDQPAPLLYVSPTQINLIVPYTIGGRAGVSLQFESNGTRLASGRMIAVAESAPAIFTLAGTQGAILNEDLTINSAQNGARPGSVVAVYATGEGLSSPLPLTGSITGGVTLPKPILPVRAFVGGREAEILYAGSAPTQVAGLFQINLRLPQGLPVNTASPIVITVGTGRSQDNVTVFVRE